MQPLSWFSLHNWQQSQGPVPGELHVSQPRQVTCWTKSSAQDGGKITFEDRSGLLPFQAVQLPANLNDGYPDLYTRKPADKASGVEPVIQAVLQAGLPLSECDVITYRNNLNKICLTPLNPGDAWAVDACSSGGPLCLDIHKLPQKSYPGSDKFEYYGYKFEALCTGEQQVDATSEFSAVVRIRLGNLRIVMAAEIDCCDPTITGQPAGEPDLAAYLELKTTRTPTTQQQDENLKAFKYPRWWLQSYLAGVPRIAVGGRDDAGMLNMIEIVNTRHLPTLSSKAGQKWDPWRLLNFGNDMLTWMRKLAGQHIGQHLHFRYHPEQQQVSCEVVADGTLPSRLASLLPPDHARQKALQRPSTEPALF
ncbi:hypothetical protein WJX72_000086 [[Myrmecia] bisecta]|uniref:Decapping nuclease n=1 Tax=[Myrmecia] bisecta TaxID=41462 RepID=A0AAW1R4V9_9CHLO